MAEAHLNRLELLAPPFVSRQKVGKRKYESFKESLLQRDNAASHAEGGDSRAKKKENTNPLRKLYNKGC